MSGINETLEEHVTCSICMDLYSDPLALGCLHSYCRRCLQGIVSSSSSLNCPECRQSFKLGKKGIDSLKRNFQLASIVASYKEQAAKEAQERSEVVKSGLTLCTAHPRIPCELACLQCKRPVCLNCVVEKHNGHSFRALAHQDEAKRNPSISEASGYNEAELCAQHGREYKLFCRDCQKLLCLNCLTSREAGHTLANITDAYKQKREATEATLQNITERQAILRQTHRSSREAAQQAQIEGQRHHQEVTQYFRNLREALDRKEEAIHTELRTREQRIVSGHVTQAEHAQKQEERGTMVLQELQRLLTEDKVTFLKSCSSTLISAVQVMSELSPGASGLTTAQQERPRLSSASVLEKEINSIQINWTSDNPVAMPRKKKGHTLSSRAPANDRASLPFSRNQVPNQGRDLQVGGQVQRGKSWKDGNRDGGPGHFGVITGTTLDPHLYMVRWPNGNTGPYSYNPPFSEEIVPL